ncbi:MAG TPA: hypothetical protein VFQ61_03255 [Polyangiaceae bacterium]|nr:hypothetical protein [Polyangiaceae bacterium]
MFTAPGSMPLVAAEPQRISFWRGALRFLAYAILINLAFLVVAGSVAWASVERTTAEVSASLLTDIPPGLLDTPRAFQINGQRVWVSSKLTRAEVPEVLEAFSAHCRDRSASLSHQLEQLPRGGASRAIRFNERLSQQLLENSGAAGHVACLAPRPRADSTSLVQSVRRFAANGDLSVFGDVRYAVARRVPETGDTHVVALWTEGPFSVAALLSHSSDAPGSDSLAAPRPANSRRLLSASGETTSYAVRIYDSPHAQRVALDDYTQQLARLGFERLELPVGSVSDSMSSSTRSFHKEGTAVLVIATPLATGHSNIALVELESPGRVEANGARELP